MEDDPEDGFAYKPLPDKDPDEERAWEKYLSAIIFEGEDLQRFPPELLEWDGYFSDEEVVPSAELIEVSDDDEQIAEHPGFSDEENEDALVAEELLPDNDSLVREPLLRQCDAIWNDFLEWPDSEYSISCDIDCPVGTLSFSIAQQDMIHWDKLIYIQDNEQWNYTDLENDSVEYSEAVCHVDLPVLPLISPQPELQESGYPRREGEYDGLQLEIPDEWVTQVLVHREGSASQPGGDPVGDVSFDAAHQESEALVDHVCLEYEEGSHSRSDLPRAKSPQPELQSDLPMSEEQEVLEKLWL